MNACLDDHTEFDELAVGWALYSLEPEDEAHFANHLPACRRCRASVARSTAVLVDLAGAIPDEDGPPSQLRDRIRIAARPALPEQAAPPRRHRRKLLAAIAATIAVGTGLGGWNISLQADRSQQAGLAQRYAHAVHDITDPGSRRADLTTLAGTPVATIVDRDNTITVVNLRMPQNDTRNTIYVLWGVHSGSGGPTPVGTFDITHRGINDSPLHATTVDRHFPGYAVSREHGRLTPTHPSTLIARGAVNRP